MWREGECLVACVSRDSEVRLCSCVGEAGKVLGVVLIMCLHVHSISTG
jgi:hypothetical protein